MIFAHEFKNSTQIFAFFELARPITQGDDTVYDELESTPEVLGQIIPRYSRTTASRLAEMIRLGNIDGGTSRVPPLSREEIAILY